MEITVEKFVNYLLSSADEIQQELIQRKMKNRSLIFSDQDDSDLKRIAERKNMARILRVPECDWNYHGELYIEFQYLTEMLEGSKLRIRDQFFIVKRLLKKNIATNILEVESKGFDIQKIDEYEFEYMTRNSFLEFCRTDEKSKIEEKEESERTEHEKKCLEEFRKFSDKYPLDLSHVQDTHRLIKEHYFDKEETLTKEDIDIFINCLLDFHLAPHIADAFRNLLLRELQKREDRERRESFTVVTSTEEVNNEKTETKALSEKEYNLLERELRPYFDLKTMTASGPLDLDRQIYAVSLMLKLRLSLDKIREILRIINRTEYVYPDSETMFLALQAKLEYYKDIEGISEAVKTLLEAMEELGLAKSTREKKEWKAFISEELTQILSLIPRGFEYEIETGKKRVQ